jgi:hypothetical protein
MVVLPDPGFGDLLSFDPGDDHIGILDFLTTGGASLNKLSKSIPVRIVSRCEECAQAWRY